MLVSVLHSLSVVCYTLTIQFPNIIVILIYCFLCCEIYNKIVFKWDKKCNAYLSQSEHKERNKWQSRFWLHIFFDQMSEYAFQGITRYKFFPGRAICNISLHN
jgi:hypothetical protein